MQETYNFCQNMLNTINDILSDHNRKAVDIGIKEYGKTVYSFILIDEKGNDLYEIEAFNAEDLANSLRYFMHGMWFAFWGE